jgi:hypothetical protein
MGFIRKKANLKAVDECDVVKRIFDIDSVDGVPCALRQPCCENIKFLFLISDFRQAQQMYL